MEAGYTTFSWNDATGQFELQGDFFPGDPSLDVVQLTDFDGDGRLDIAREEPDLSPASGAADLGQWLIALNQGGTFSAFEETGLLSVQGGLARAMDIDGDGRGDLLPIDSDTVIDGADDSTAIPGATDRARAGRRRRGRAPIPRGGFVASISSRWPT